MYACAILKIIVSTPWNDLVSVSRFVSLYIYRNVLTGALSQMKLTIMLVYITCLCFLLPVIIWLPVAQLVQYTMCMDFRKALSACCKHWKRSYQ